MKTPLADELYELILKYGDLKYIIGQRHFRKCTTHRKEEQIELKIRLEEDLEEKEAILDEIIKLLNAI